MKLNILILFSAINLSVFSQTINYNDVAVIVNDNSQTSIDIANYFQALRNIPNVNMIHISAPLTEEIDSLQFEQIRSQIENYLQTNNLADSINYIVTTKGVPLKVESGCFDPQVSSDACASFDSELTLILGPNSNQIGLNGSIGNPVYNTTGNFSHVNSGIYLVTRLDGYSKEDVYNLLDRSGPLTGLNQQSAQAIIDLNAATASDSAYFMNYYLVPTYDFLNNNSWNVQLDANYSPLLNQGDVFFYNFEGHGPLTNVNLNYSWTFASIGALSSCKTASTFDSTTNTSNDFIIADLIAEGCTGAHGNVDCIYFSQMLNSENLVSRYLDPVMNYNLAESFYMAEPRLSWQAVIVGDPKTSIIISDEAGISESSLYHLNIYPNPSNGIININANESISSITVFDMSGALVRQFEQLHENSVQLDLQGIKKGHYILHVSVGERIMRERIVIH